MLRKIILGLVGLFVLAILGGGGFAFSQMSAYDASMSKVYDVPVNTKFKAHDFAEVAALFDKGEDPTRTGEPTEAAEAAPSPKEGEAKEGEAKAGDTATDAAPAEDPAAAEKAKKLAEMGRLYQRGKHLAEAIGACTGCHGPDYATPEVIPMGPLGTISSPNVTMNGVLKDYSDGEFLRLMQHGIKKDGTSLVFMPAFEMNWWPEDDYAALLGYLRTVPNSDKPAGKPEIKALGKIMDRMDNAHIDVARRIDHTKKDVAPKPAANARYGSYVGKLCMGCHGVTYSGGPIPGAPPSLPVPVNITTHQSGIAHYDFAKFDKVMREGIKPDGSKLDPFMPIGNFKEFDEVEMKALWEFLKSLEQKPFGGR
jgi:mono/diheme cytochrome c family protein